VAKFGVITGKFKSKDAYAIVVEGDKEFVVPVEKKAYDALDVPEVDPKDVE
jgi:hypothetical protein